MEESAPKTKRRWTLEGSRALLQDVRARTETAARTVDELLEKRDACDPNSEAFVELDSQLRIEVSRWVRAMEALGVDVKGLWLVDFDNGSGYYCWKWPEEALGYFHGYEEGFEGRVRIQ